MTSLIAIGEQIDFFKTSGGWLKTIQASTNAELGNKQSVGASGKTNAYPLVACCLSVFSTLRCSLVYFIYLVPHDCLITSVNSS